MCRISASAASPQSNCPLDPNSSPFDLLELAANDDLEGFKEVAAGRSSLANERAIWYCRQFGSNKMASVERSPIMIAAMFGSMKVLKFLLDLHGGDVNIVCGADKVSALHCAMASGTQNMADAVRLLIKCGADPTLVSPQGLRGTEAKLILQTFQAAGEASFGKEKSSLGGKYVDHLPLQSDAVDWNVVLPDSVSDTSFEDLEESMRTLQDCNAGGGGGGGGGGCQATWSPNSISSQASDNQDGTPDRSFDVLASDVKSGIYSSDEFRMYSFKVRPCSRAYSHDWTECPFAHPGENARRRDPRRFHYSCVPCPEFRKGACRHGDACEYAHGVFESWLHPAQYRTRLCKDGTSCARKVCFFAHTKEEVRPLYTSTECGVGSCPSPCASPSSVKSLSCLPGGMNLGPLSPSSVGNAWTQPGLPTLRLPEGIAHPSHLRASLSARDMSLAAEGPSMKDLFSLSAQARINAAFVAAASTSSALNSPVRERKLQSFGSSIGLAANFEDSMYNAVSPRSPLQMGMQSSPRMASKFHEHLGSSHGNASLEELIVAMSSPRHSLHGRSMQGQYDEWGKVAMASQHMGSTSLSGKMGSNSSSSSSPSSHAEVGFLRKRSMESSACLSPAHGEEKPWMDWGSPTGKLEWGVSGDDLARFRKSYSFKA